MPSVSSTLRMGIGPSKGRLNKSLLDGVTLADSAIPETIEDRKQLLNSIWQLVPRMESQIETLSDHKQQWMDLIYELESEDDKKSEEKLFSDTVYGIDGFMNTVWDAKETVSMLKSLAGRLSAAPTPLEASVNSAMAPVVPGNKATTTVKLPKLQLPIFSGDYLEWDQFWQLFRVNVHDSSLSKVEKFAYLRGQITGTALDAVEGITVSEENYEIAVSALQARFKRAPRQLVSSYYSQLKRLGQSSVKPSDLQRTYDACERIFRLLEAAGEKLDTNQSLVLDVFSKYPNSVIERLFSHRGISATSTLKEVREALAVHLKEVESLSEIFEELKPFGSNKAEKGNVSAKVSEGSSSVSQYQQHTSALASAVVAKPRPAANDRRSSDSPKSNCYFCNGAHFNSECNKYTTTVARLLRLQQLARCTRCLSSTHLLDGCRTPPKTITCFFCRQVGEHRSPLCPQRFSPKEPQSEAAATLVSADLATNGASVALEKSESTLLNAGESSLLLTALTMVCNPSTGQKVQARLIFDTGSHRTYVTESCAAEVSLLQDNVEKIRIATFGSQRTMTVESSQVEINIVQRDGSLKSLRANTTPIIAGGSILPDRLPHSAAHWLEAMRDELADDYSVKPGQVDILVGTDYFWEFITGSQITTSFGIHLVPSTLGLLLTGKYKDDDPKETPATLLCLTETRSSIAGVASAEAKFPVTYPDIDEFWALERIGITDDPREDDDTKALEQFNQSVYLKDGRYHVSWPWKPDVKDLPTNSQLALGRFRSLAKRLASGPGDLKEKYNNIIAEQLRLGIIEKVDSTERVTHPVHYLPHHPVVRPGSATTKVRIVYDASSKTRKDQKSLNECLYRGPVLLPDLCSLLIRFRLDSAAIIADIEKAFLQIALQPNDRDVTRFLWFKDPYKDLIENNIAIYRFCRVPFGVITSPFLLGATVRFHLNNWNTSTAEKINKNMYVDNSLNTISMNEPLKPFYEEAKAMFSAAGMNLTEWSSNHPELKSVIPESDRSRSEETKVLGVKWDCKNDTLSLKEPTKVECVQSVTKRSVLKYIASIFDPLGWFQPATLSAKHFLKTLWLQNRGWDESLPSDTCSKWSEIYDDSKHIFHLKFPRSIGEITPGGSQILAFSDASAIAYGTAVYLRTESSSGCSTTLLFAKSRLAPKGCSDGDTSIPRLELLGLAIAVRATRFVRAALEMELPVCVFCDSSCVLGWLSSAKVLPVFVRNRIDDIKQLQNARFRHIKSEDNPADLCSRGVSASTLGDSQLWWHGPSWINKHESSWPNTNDQLGTQSSFTDHKHKQQNIFHSFVVAEAPPREEGGFLAIDPSSYSTLRRLLRVTVVCLKFMKKFLWNQLSPQSRRERWADLDNIFDRVVDGAGVTADELRLAKVQWVLSAQRTDFTDLRKCMKSSVRHPLVKQLDTTFDEAGLIRCVGRFEHADLPADAIRPILLPRDNAVTILIIREIHEKMFHSGVSHTLGQLRREFWVTRGRAVVRRELKRCKLCCKYKGPHFALPRMPPWPRERVAHSKPFQYVGLDYLGPVNITIRGEIAKMWVCLITCLSTRAIHLEWISDCTAVSFVDAVSRFVARRGLPDQIICDNAPQFRVAKNVFDRAWHQTFTAETTTSYMANNGIKWKYTTELSPWQGGFYERLVGLVKQTFRMMVGRRLLKWDEFITLVTEIEPIINCRPLTYVYEDFESGFVLRPCDFLTELPTGIHDIDPARRPEGGDAEKNLIRYWKSKQKRLNKLWDYWQDEYLLSLRERGHIDHRGVRRPDAEGPFVNQVVLIKNPGAPRGSWKLGRVVNLITSADNEIRSVDVMLPSRIVLRRSVSHLYPVEIDPQIQELEQEQGTNDETDGNESSDGHNQNNNNDEEVEDGFSGFSESEVYGDTRIDHVMLTNPSQIHSLIHEGLTRDAMTLAFEKAESAPL